MLSTKERILIAATDLLDAGGPSAVTLRAVGEAAGVSQSAPYRHYVDKRALLDAMVRRIIEQLAHSVESARNETASSIAALNLVVSQYFEFARRYPVRYRLLLEECRSDSAVAARSARGVRGDRGPCAYRATIRRSQGWRSREDRRAHLRRRARHGGPRAVRPHQGRIRFGLLV